LVSPRYTAIIGYGSAFRLDFVRVAAPALFRVAVPIVYVCVKYFHMKATVPVGGIEPPLATTAKKIIVCPYVEGFRLEVKVVEVG
jgi:hypothetical protein